MSSAQQYAAMSAPFTQLVPTLSAQDWDAASPCEGWTARDVLAHMIDTQREFFSRNGIDLPERPNVEADPAKAWATHDQTVSALMARDEIASQEMQTPFGASTVGESLVNFYGFDTVVHRWDIARSAGRQEDFSEAELDLLETALAGFGEHAYDEGIFKPGVEAPAGASRQEQVLARMGRVGS